MDELTVISQEKLESLFKELRLRDSDKIMSGENNYYIPLDNGEGIRIPKNLITQNTSPQDIAAMLSDLKPVEHYQGHGLPLSGSPDGITILKHIKGRNLSEIIEEMGAEKFVHHISELNQSTYDGFIQDLKQKYIDNELNPDIKLLNLMLSDKGELYSIDPHNQPSGKAATAKQLLTKFMDEMCGEVRERSQNDDLEPLTEQTTTITRKLLTAAINNEGFGIDENACKDFVMILDICYGIPVDKENAMPFPVTSQDKESLSGVNFPDDKPREEASKNCGEDTKAPAAKGWDSFEVTKEDKIEKSLKDFSNPKWKPAETLDNNLPYVSNTPAISPIHRALKEL